MGIGGSVPKPLATAFGTEEGRRGPTLGSVLVAGAEQGSWRLALAAPLRLEVFDGLSAESLALIDAASIREHFPFTACTTTVDSSCCHMPCDEPADDQAGSSILMALGCQDGTVFVFDVRNHTTGEPSMILNPPPATTVPEERPQPDEGIGTRTSRSLALCITVLRFDGIRSLFGGVAGRCFYWDLASGSVQQTFELAQHPSGMAATPTTMVVLAGPLGRQLWVGTDHGSIEVFDVDSGDLQKSLDCGGAEALMSLAYFPSEDVVFALSAYRRVCVWSTEDYACLQRYPAELMTCGSDLSVMISVYVEDPEMALLLLAGVDGSLCVRRVNRRTDGKLNCVLLSFFEHCTVNGAPVTSLGYHAGTDSVLLGDAGCSVALLSKFKEQLGTSVQSQGEIRQGIQPPSTRSRSNLSSGSSFVSSGTVPTTPKSAVTPVGTTPSRAAPAPATPAPAAAPFQTPASAPEPAPAAAAPPPTQRKEDSLVTSAAAAAAATDAAAADTTPPPVASTAAAGGVPPNEEGEAVVDLDNIDPGQFEAYPGSEEPTVVRAGET